MFPLRAKHDRANRTIEGIEGFVDPEPQGPMEDSDGGELFSELQEEAEAPAPGGAPPEVMPPAEPPAAVELPGYVPIGN